MSFAQTQLQHAICLINLVRLYPRHTSQLETKLKNLILWLPQILLKDTILNFTTHVQMALK
jgi:hypothetical protein